MSIVTANLFTVLVRAYAPGGVDIPHEAFRDTIIFALESTAIQLALVLLTDVLSVMCEETLGNASCAFWKSRADTVARVSCARALCRL